MFISKSLMDTISFHCSFFQRKLSMVIGCVWNRTKCIPTCPEPNTSGRDVKESAFRILSSWHLQLDSYLLIPLVQSSLVLLIAHGFHLKPPIVQLTLIPGKTDAIRLSACNMLTWWCRGSLSYGQILTTSPSTEHCHSLPLPFKWKSQPFPSYEPC